LQERPSGEEKKDSIEELSSGHRPRERGKRGKLAFVVCPRRIGGRGVPFVPEKGANAVKVKGN